jgi:hypothetical protein
MAAVRAHPSRLEREREERNFECQEAEESGPADRCSDTCSYPESVVTRCPIA